MKKQSQARPRKSTTPASRGKSVATGARVTSSVSERASSTSFPIVGVGASAGGLEAFIQLLEALPSNTGMAFVLIQHLDRTQPSFLAEAIAKATTMTVTQARDGEPVEPNHIYVIPPNADLAILHGSLTLLTRRDEPGRLHLPIDFFLRSLAEERGSHAIGVILSGTASDGTEGLRAIKREDGITFAQDPRSAAFDDMPRNAIEAGVVDCCLELPELARELVRLSLHPYVSAAELQGPDDEATLNKIFVIVRNAVGIDFSEYKAPTFERRLARRIALRKAQGIQDYLELLQEDPTEVASLYEDTLIHVTSFFRDPEVFESLKAHAFPEILTHKSSGEPVRLWVAGCSTGEEVYSLAMNLLEFLDSSLRQHPVQLFGSDISEKAIEKARQGIFLHDAMKDVSDERRKRFFTKTETGYRINKSVRDLCVFARHDLARDPPFSKLDLVSCRNVLIYFGQALQKRVIPIFHYALNPGGFLLLGRTENISGFSKLFSPLGGASKVFARTSATSALRFAARSEVRVVPAKVIPRGRVEYPRPSVDLAKHLDQVLATRYSPPGVLVNEKMEVLRFHGATGAYLRPAPGEPQSNVIKMLRGGLVVELRAAMARAKAQMAPVRSEGIEVDQDGFSKTCDLVVLPLTGLHDPHEPLFVILFEEATSSGQTEEVRKLASRPDTPDDALRVNKLEQKLAATEEYLQSLIDDQDKTNDYLNAANEELVSGNEELQSMNEELETAKEELQSTNEELTTVNDELHTRNHELGAVNSDLLNLLSTVDVPVLILDVHRRIRRFTPKARGILNILPSDIGRPLDDIKPNLQVDNLEQRIAEVIDTITVHESEVQARDGRWYRMQIRPYKTVDNKIDGATLSLIDIDGLKRQVDEMEKAKLAAESVNRAKPRS